MIGSDYTLVSFFEHSKFEVIAIRYMYTDNPNVSTLVFEINKIEV